MLVASSSKIPVFNIKHHSLIPRPSPSVVMLQISVRTPSWMRVHSSLIFDSTDVSGVWYIFPCSARPLHGCPEYTKGPYKNVLRSRRRQFDGSSSKVDRTLDRRVETNQHRIPTVSACCREGTLPAFCWPPHRDWFVCPHTFPTTIINALVDLHESNHLDRNEQ